MFKFNFICYILRRSIQKLSSSSRTGQSSGPGNTLKECLELKTAMLCVRQAQCITQVLHIR